jgi:hypothetical protein
MLSQLLVMFCPRALVFYVLFAGSCTFWHWLCLLVGLCCVRALYVKGQKRLATGRTASTFTHLACASAEKALIYQAEKRDREQAKRDGKAKNEHKLNLAKVLNVLSTTWSTTG